ncbi:MAG: hypothetical protein E6G35_17395 [Actinobacteria bacterium]|nr:MAG: hypothetical protein E6G35_17395 [Actinomycetota bacterium]
MPVRGPVGTRPAGLLEVVVGRELAAVDVLHGGLLGTRTRLLTGAGVVVPTRLDRAGWLAAPFPGRGVVLRRSPPGMCGRLGGAPVVVVYRTGGATGRVRRFLPLVVDPHDVLLYRSRLGVGC